MSSSTTNATKRASTASTVEVAKKSRKKSNVSNVTTVAINHPPSFSSPIPPAQLAQSTQPTNSTSTLLVISGGTAQLIKPNKSTTATVGGVGVSEGGVSSFAEFTSSLQSFGCGYATNQVDAASVAPVVPTTKKSRSKTATGGVTPVVNASQSTATAATAASSFGTFDSLTTLSGAEKKLVKQVSSQLDFSRDVQIPENVISNSKQQLNPNDFYLYHDLEKQILKQSTSFTSTQQQQVIQNIQQLDIQGGRIVFLLIRMYALLHPQHSTNTQSSTQQLHTVFDMPYEGKILTRSTVDNNADIQFDLQKLPTQLQHMLYLFTNKHLETMECEQQRATF